MDVASLYRVLNGLLIGYVCLVIKKQDSKPFKVPGVAYPLRFVVIKNSLVSLSREFE